MHINYLPKIGASEGLSFVTGKSICLWFCKSGLHKAHVDVRGVSPLTDTAGDLLSTEMSSNWLHKGDANISLAANNSTLLSALFSFFSFSLGFITDIFFRSSFSFFLFFPSLLGSFFFPSDVDSDPSWVFSSFSFSFVFFSFSLDSFPSLVLCSPWLFLL